MKYKSETKYKWAEEMNNDELIKDIENTRLIGKSLSIIGILTILLSTINYLFGFLGIAIMIAGIEAHIRMRYFQIIKLIKNKKEEIKK